MGGLSPPAFKRGGGGGGGGGSATVYGIKHKEGVHPFNYLEDSHPKDKRS